MSVTPLKGREAVGDRPAGRQGTSRGIALRHGATPYLFLLPATLALLIIFVYPMLRATYLGFQTYDQLFGAYEFVGLANYADLLRDGDFWNSLRVSAIWVVGSVIGQFLIGFGVAQL